MVMLKMAIVIERMLLTMVRIKMEGKKPVTAKFNRSTSWSKTESRKFVKSSRYNQCWGPEITTRSRTIKENIINNNNNIKIESYLKFRSSPGVMQYMGTRPKGSRPSTGERRLRLWIIQDTIIIIIPVLFIIKIFTITLTSEHPFLRNSTATWPPELWLPK